jgi:hypothetical protein
MVTAGGFAIFGFAAIGPGLLAEAGLVAVSPSKKKLAVRTLLQKKAGCENEPPCDRYNLCVSSLPPSTLKISFRWLLGPFLVGQVCRQLCADALAVCLFFLAWAVGVRGRLHAERCWGLKIYFGSFDLLFSASGEFAVRPASMHSTMLSVAAGWVVSHSVRVRRGWFEVFFLCLLNLSPFCVCMLFILLF